MPFATSEIVPSPPQAMISFVPFRAAFGGQSQFPLRTCVVNFGLNAPKCAASSLAIFGHASRVAPPADSGLMMTSGKDILR